MIHRGITGFFVLMIAVVSGPALADTFVPGHTCTQPVKPARFNDNQEVDMFNEAVADYKMCISTFVDEQNAKADAHRSAAGEAIDEWNRYVEDNNLN